LFIIIFPDFSVSECNKASKHGDNWIGINGTVGGITSDLVDGSFVAASFFDRGGDHSGHTLDFHRGRLRVQGTIFMIYCIGLIEGNILQETSVFTPNLLGLSMNWHFKL
jgi:hypothetical protein